jgi:hypothetical protein
MNKKLMTALTAPAFFAALAFGGLASAATYTPTVGISDGNQSYSALYTESSWQTLTVPLSSIGGTVPSDLSLSTTGLPDGVTISLTGTSVSGGYLILSVDTERSTTANDVNALANVTLLSGTTPLASFQVPVLGSAVSTDMNF